MSMFTQTKLTFNDLVKIEPELGRLLKDARAYWPRLGKTCPVRDWYKDFKPRLVKLVGWYARSDNPIIKGHAAYDLCYQKIMRAMDRCPRGCQGCNG